MDSKSYYVEQVKKNWPLLVAAVIVAGVCVAIFYPGVFYSDSYRRVDFARALAYGNTQDRQMWLTPTPSYFMALALKLTGEIGVYSFFQAFSYLYLSMLLIRKLASHYRVLQYVLFLLNPAMVCVSVYYEAGIGCLCGMMAMMLVLMTYARTRTILDKVIGAGVFLLTSFVTFGYRANALTIIPVILVAVWVLVKTKWGRGALYGTFLAGLILVSMLPRLLGIDTMSSVATSFVWEILSTIQGVEYPEQTEYYNYLDEIAGPGTTYDALEDNNDTRVGQWLWGTGLNYESLSEEGVLPVVIEKYINIAVKEPKAFWKNKLHSIRYTLGVGRELDLDEWQYNLNNEMAEYGFHDGALRKNTFDLYRISAERQVIWQHPWILILAATLLMALYTRIRRKTCRERDREYWIVWGMALCYYGAFFLNTQSFEVRYFFPTACLLLLLSIAVVCDLVKPKK